MPRPILILTVVLAISFRVRKATAKLNFCSVVPQAPLGNVEQLAPVQENNHHLPTNRGTGTFRAYGDSKCTNDITAMVFDFPSIELTLDGACRHLPSQPFAYRGECADSGAFEIRTYVDAACANTVPWKSISAGPSGECVEFTTKRGAIIYLKSDSSELCRAQRRMSAFGRSKLLQI